MTSLHRILGISGLVLMSVAQAGEPVVAPIPPAAEPVSEPAPPTDPVMLKLYRRAVSGEAVAQQVLGRHYATGAKVKKDPQSALFWYLKAAMQGNAVAQSALGELYRKGEGVRRNTNEALRWYRFAAEAGVADARFALGEMHESGDGVKKDFDEAARWYRVAATQNVTLAQYRLATLISNRKTEPQSAGELLSLLRAAADGGHAAAQYACAMTLLNARGRERNTVEAARRLSAAAEQNLPEAQYRYGLLYLHGEGVSKDTVKAEHWFGLAADRGVPEARLELGCLLAEHPADPVRDTRAASLLVASARTNDARALYAMGMLTRAGRGFKKNIPVALAYLQAAAVAGDSRASYELACWYENGGDGVSANRRLFENWLERATDQGSIPAKNHRAFSALGALQRAAQRGEAAAQYTLAQLHESGEGGLAVDPAEALRWYVAAADQGHAQAQREAAKRYAAGTGTAKNLAAAMNLYRLAGKQGDADSWLALGRLYTEDKDIPKDQNEATYCLRAAAELGDAYSQYWYGVRCWNGDGTAPDQVMGYAWVLLSIESGMPEDGKTPQKMKDQLDEYGRRRAAERIEELRRSVRARLAEKTAKAK
jgi:TPR repeat protein